MAFKPDFYIMDFSLLSVLEFFVFQKTETYEISNHPLCGCHLTFFLNIPHNEINRLEAWLYFIVSDRLEDIKKVCDTYPEFRTLYWEVFRFRYHPKELVEMFSEALRMLDAGTVQYMIDDMHRKLEELKEEKERMLVEVENKAAEKEQIILKISVCLRNWSDTKN